jgi:hypothetical protein
MGAVLAVATVLAAGLTVLPESQAQSCVTNGESDIDGKGFTSSESVSIEIEQGDIERCVESILVTGQSD